jgi:uncharacterized protein YndB with AHSA1/START domain
MSTNVADLTVRKSVLVAAPIERAWEVFTERITSWWPIATHSIGKEKIEDVVVEGHVGGRMYERRRGGEEENWATVRVWEPPERLVLTWEITDRETEVEVRFAPDGEGTRVELEHRGWERAGKDAHEARRNYSEGWGYVLGRFQEAWRS